MENSNKLSEEDIYVGLKAFSWKAVPEFRGYELYHYYKGRTVKRVLKSDKVRFRLSVAEEFPDKMEGQAIKVYYILDTIKLEIIPPTTPSSIVHK